MCFCMKAACDKWNLLPFKIEKLNLKSSLLNNASTEQCSYAQVILMTGLDQRVLPVNLFGQ